MLVHYPVPDPVDRPVGWIHSLCTRDWILWVDDDEIPVRRARRVGPRGDRRRLRDPLLRSPAHALARAASVLDGPPWVPDFQLRLVVERPASRLVPRDHALADPGDRASSLPRDAALPHRSAAQPGGASPGQSAPLRDRGPGRRVAGLPMNDAYFLPEDRPSVELAPVAAPDRETIARILELEPWPEPRPPSAPLRLATRGRGRRALARRSRDGRALPRPPRGGRGRRAVRGRRAAGHRRARRESRLPRLAAGRCRVAVDSRGLPLARRRGRDRGRRGAPHAPPRHARAGDSLAHVGRRARAARPGLARARPRPAPRARALVRMRAAVAVDVRAALCVAILGEDDEGARRAAAALAEVAPDVRPLVLSAAPAETQRAPRLRSGARCTRLRPRGAARRASAGRPARSGAPALSSATRSCAASAASRGSPRRRQPCTSRA